MDNINNEEMILTPKGEQIMPELEMESGQGDHPNFIESNTHGISFEELIEQHVTPTFADGSLTLSSGDIIKATMKAAEEVFGELTPVEIRVSHRIQGRTPEAMNKPTSELTDDDTTTFYQRMAFVARVKSITREINGVEAHLVVAGCRAYNEDKLFSRPSPSKVKLAVGWMVRVCSNSCITSDGASGSIECMTAADVYEHALSLFNSFNPKKEDALEMLENLGNTFISEKEFCQIIGRLRLYQALPISEQNKLPKFILGDQAVNKIVYGFVSNKNFGKQPEEERISLWQFLQLANESVKQGSYINDFFEKILNCTSFTFGLQRAILGLDQDGYDWFLS